MKRWKASFKDASSLKTLDRRKWDDKRDLYVEGVPAVDDHAARVAVFKIANKFLKNPYLDDLEEM
jgi:hypothetical protein